MKILDSNKVGMLIIAVIVILGVFICCYEVVQTIPIESIPAPLVPYWKYIVMLFGTAGATFIFGFGRNILGYLRNWWSSGYKADYDIKRLYSTWMYYAGTFTTINAVIFSVIPGELGVIIQGVAQIIIVLFDFGASEIKRLKTSIKNG